MFLRLYGIASLETSYTCKAYDRYVIMVYMPYFVREWYTGSHLTNPRRQDGQAKTRAYEEQSMRTFDDMLNDEMQDEEFRKEYEDIQPEMDVIRALAAARISQNLTQKELAERSGINQADISKIENCTRNPSLNLLKRLADAMGMTLKIQFIPKHP